MTFVAPTDDQILAITVNADMAELALHAAFADASPDMVEAIANGIGQFAAGEWAPLDRIGDTIGAKMHDGTVTMPEGYVAAYAALVEQGWTSISCPVEWGGQGLPLTLSTCVMETLGTANLAFTLLPTLTPGAVEALQHHGAQTVKEKYLTKLVTGQWASTMNLTEPQAGSDVGALRTSATAIVDGPEAGRYRIKGTKIFITYGEHDLAENIVHLVLARLPDAPAGSRGISLFVVPKFLPDATGRPGKRNDLRVVSIEHKMGIHASPTCVMSYGENDDCIGELVGAENEGLRCMFTMMNSARVNVGSQGVQVAAAALRKASAFARERVQSARAGSADKAPVAIIRHPDVRRMLLRMRALTEAGRALVYYTAGQVDRSMLGVEGAQMRADVLVPMLKAWGTDLGCEVASLGIQVHGGAGFVEETGAAQHYRDARITPIYEGTNGIQAADLVTRKLGYGHGAEVLALLADVEADAGDGALTLAALARSCARVARWMVDEASLDDRLAGSVPFCTMCAVAVAGWQLLRQHRALSERETPQSANKAAVSGFFMSHIVPEALGLEATAMSGAALLYDVPDSVFEV